MRNTKKWNHEVSVTVRRGGGGGSQAYILAPVTGWLDHSQRGVMIFLDMLHWGATWKQQAGQQVCRYGVQEREDCQLSVVRQ